MIFSILSRVVKFLNICYQCSDQCEQQYAWQVWQYCVLVAPAVILVVLWKDYPLPAIALSSICFQRFVGVKCGKIFWIVSLKRVISLCFTIVGSGSYESEVVFNMNDVSLSIIIELD
jgi:hypothetical protein